MQYIAKDCHMRYVAKSLSMGHVQFTKKYFAHESRPRGEKCEHFLQTKVSRL